MSFFRNIAFISDLHYGSRYAVFPPSMTMQKQLFIPSPAQCQLNEYLEDFNARCTEMKVDTIVINGDTLHGQNYKQRGAGLITPDLDEQINIAVVGLQGIVKGRKLLMFPGSEYHKSTQGHNPEKDVCDRLGGQWMGMVANVQFAPSKRVFNIHHGQSSAFIYREMLMGREGLFTKWAESLGKIPKIDVIVRGHWHNFVYIHENQLHMIQLPCWAGFEPSRVTLKLYAKMQPDIGGVIVSLDEKDRIRVWHYLYDCPPMENEVQIL